MSLIEEEERNILYELLVYYEWLVENDKQAINGQKQHTRYKSWLAIPSQLTFPSLHLWPSSAILPLLKRIFNYGCDWHLGIGLGGTVIAIVQQSVLEIRAEKDNYSLAVGKSTNLYEDPFPSWRKVTFCHDCCMCAIGYSNGVVEIFNSAAISLFKVYPPRFQDGYVQRDSNNALAALFFSNIRTQGLKWATEMVLIDFHGNIRSYFISAAEGYQDSTAFSFQKIYTSGITAAVSIGSVLVIAGLSGYETDQRLKMNGIGHGLTIWRMINEYPYYQQMPTIDQEEFHPASATRILPGFGAVPHDAIFRLRVSPLRRQVAAIHVSGSVSIWDLPSLRKRKFWPLKDQPHYQLKRNRRGKHIDAMQISELLNHPIDVKWWSEKAIILARLSGVVTVCSVNSLSNLLGSSPEYFEGVPQISDANDKCFLALEVKWHKENCSTTQPIICSKENAGYKHLIKNALYWATDSERFQPAQNGANSSIKTYRLLSLTSTTPEELYLRKIEIEEYGDALALAHKYRLDCDLVYHRQWCTSPVTTATIQDYLAKIKKRSLVLSECLTRVPDDMESARELLLFGVRGTELDTLVALKKGNDKADFILSDLAMEYEEDFDWDDENSNVRLEEMAAHDLQKRTELINQIDFFNLSPAQINVIDIRQKLLLYYDRLGTYEAYLGGMNQAAEDYDSKFFEKFRQQSEIEACLEFARLGNWRGVEAMFTYHGSKTLKHRIAILSNFPPMLGPFEYRSILPECDLSGQVFDWAEDIFRDPDWCEDEICSRRGDNRALEIEHTLYDEPNYLKDYKESALTANNISQWYLLRAREIERKARFVDVALDLLRLGRQRNVAGLDDLLGDMDSLEVLIYEIGISDVNLSQYEQLTDLEKLKLFMSTSTIETHMHNLRSWAIPFLEKCETKQSGARSLLLRNYIVSTAKSDLTIALKAIKHSKGDAPSHRIIESTEDILNVAIDSIYYCENPTQLPRAYAIVEYLPVREKNDCEKILALNQEVDILEDLLEVSEILTHYDVVETPTYLRSVQNDKRGNISLLSKVARSFLKRKKLVKLSDWEKLVSDAIELQQKIFYQLQISDVYEIITDAMLSSGIVEYLNFSREFMEMRHPDETAGEEDSEKTLVPYEKSLSLVLKAARDYFNSAEAYNSDEIQLARHCLKLIDSENADITEELDLISAIQILPDFSLKMLPLQVRLCEDRLGLVAECISSSEVRYYHGARLLHLSKLLRVCSGDNYQRESKVVSLLAKAALQTQDFDSASIWCDQIVTKGYIDGWIVCAALARCHKFGAITLKAKLLDFALAHADGQMLDNLLSDRNEIELSLLYTSVQKQIQPNLSFETEESFEDANDAVGDSGDEFCDAVSEDAKISTPFSQIIDAPMDITKGLLMATASTTSKIASTVTTRKFWKGASSWLSPFVNEATKKIMGRRESQKNDKKQLFQIPSCHAYYTDLWPLADRSSLGITYESYACAVWEKNTLFVPFNVLRFALMSESVDYIATEQLDGYGMKEELATQMLFEDLPLGLSFVLSVLTADDAEKLFKSLPQTELCLQVALYYYSIQIHSRLVPHANARLAPLYLLDPSELVATVTGLVSDNDTFGDDVVVKRFTDHFRRTTNRLREFIESEDLRDLGATVDIDRFLCDPLYKTDTLLGLALTSDPTVLRTAVKHAQKYGVALSKIYLASLEFMFDTSAAIEYMEDMVAQWDMVAEFKKNLPAFVTHMETNVLIRINGMDHKRLCYFYDTLLAVGGANPAYEAYLKILSYLTANNISVDFKPFVGAKSNLLTVLKPVLTAKTVAKFASFVELLPVTGVSASSVFRTWALDVFFTTAKSKTQNISREWISRFSSVARVLKSMEVADIVLVVERIFLSEDTSGIPLDSKQEIAKLLLKNCITLKEDRSEATGNQFQVLIRSLENIKCHLQRLESSVFQTLLRSAPPLGQYAKLYEMTGGAEEPLNRLSRQVLLDGCSLDVLREMLAIYPEEFSFVPEDIFMEVVQQVLSNIAQGQDLFGVLEHLLKEFVADTGELFSEDDMIENIRHFLNSNEGAVDCKVKILRLAQKYLQLDSDDVRALHALKTGEIVQTVFASASQMEDEVTVSSNVQTEAEKLRLFQKLLTAITSSVQAESVFELLSIWPPFTDSIYADAETNPWCGLIRKLAVSMSQDCDPLKSIHLLHSTVKHSTDQNQLTASLLSPMLSNLIKSNDGPCLLEISKIALMHGDPATISDAVDALNATHNPCDDILFQVIVEKKLVSRILSCWFYGQFYSYLRDTGDNELISAAACQLKDSGNILEGVSIQMLSSPLPTALRTVTYPLLKALNKFI